jgi:hypothetical protein
LLNWLLSCWLLGPVGGAPNAVCLTFWLISEEVGGPLTSCGTNG